MKHFTVGPNDAGQRLDRFLAKIAPLLPGTLAQKYIRLKRVRVNGVPGKRDTRLAEGDELAIYIGDEFFNRPDKDNAYLAVSTPDLEIVYEDANIILCDKRAGMSVHADSFGAVGTLIANIQAYLYQKNEWNPKQENSFAPALCNRIDRNTSGLVIAAKNAAALRDVDGLVTLLRRELDDLARLDIVKIDIGQWDRTFDAFLHQLLQDESLEHRVKAAAEKVAQLRVEISRVISLVVVQGQRLVTEANDLVATRDALVGQTTTA